VCVYACARVLECVSQTSPGSARCCVRCVCPHACRFNTHVVLDSSGNTIETYRKVHLFDVDVPNGPVLMESRTTAPGDKVCVGLC
jgi:predicted amidohydrolase